MMRGKRFPSFTVMQQGEPLKTVPQEKKSNLEVVSAREQSRQGPPTLRFYCDEFVFDVVSGMFYRMNPTACFLLRALAEGADPRQLPVLLQERYDLTQADARRDVELFLNDLATLEPLDFFHHRR